MSVVTEFVILFIVLVIVSMRGKIKNVWGEDERKIKKSHAI